MDTRQKLEADIRQWLDSRLIGNEVFETVISWIDRQAAITERICRSITDSYEDAAAMTIGDLRAVLEATTRDRDRLRKQLDEYDGDCYCGATAVRWYERSMQLEAHVNELLRKSNEFKQTIAELNGAVCERDARIGAYERRNAELNDALKAICNRYGVGTKLAAEDAVKNVFEAIDSTHMRLPVDVDGVPIHIGDTMERVCAEVPETFIVGLIGADGHCMDDETSFFIASECRHVKPDTVESLLKEFTLKMTENMGMYTAESIEADEWKRLDEKTIAEYAERIRKAVE